MNSVNLVGRMTKDPELRYGAGEGNAVCKFTLAVNRRFNREEADFPRIVCFKKLAEIVAEYCTKGSQVAVTGSIRTDSYEKDGKRIYTTEVIADEVEFVGKKE